MATTVKLVLRSDKKDKQGKSTIYIRFTKNRKASYVSTGMRIEEKFWDNKSCRIKIGYPNSSRANSFLTKLLFEYENKILTAQTQDTAVSVKALKEKITGGSSQNLFSIGNILLERYKSYGSVSTYKKAKSILNKIEIFVGHRNLTMKDITVSFLYKYEKYLRHVIGNKTNSINRDLRFIRRIYNEAFVQGLTEYQDSPFLKFKLKTERTYKQYLTEEEFSTLENLDVSDSKVLPIHCHMFIFSSYAGGIRISDVLLLKKTDYNGSHINFIIKKTGNQHSIKLPTKALQIAEMYKNDTRDKTTFLFPVVPPDLNLKDPIEVHTAISRGTALVNKSLKRLMERAGIQKKISYHCSRVYFGITALRKGFHIEQVQHVFNHASIKQAQEYARLINEDVDRAMSKFDE